MLLFHRPETEGSPSQTFRLTILPVFDESKVGVIGGAALDGGADRCEMYYIPDLTDSEGFHLALQGLLTRVGKQIYTLLCLEFTDAYEDGLAMRLLKEEVGFDAQTDDDSVEADRDLAGVQRRVEGTNLEAVVGTLLAECREELAAMVLYVRQAGRLAGLEEHDNED